MQDELRIGSCNICGSVGQQVIMKDTATGDLLVQCDECLSQWETPEKARKYLGSLIESERQHLAIASAADVKKARWDKWVTEPKIDWSSVLFICPVCGFPELTEPAYDKYGCSSFNICPCCGVEFGYQDATSSKADLPKRHAALRTTWIAGGMVWHSASDRPPKDWNPKEQLRNVMATGTLDAD